LISRAILKARELETALQKAARRLEYAADPASLSEAEELAAKAAERATEAQRAASLFAGMVKTEVAVCRRRALW
jgi:hypothetical protein